MNHKYFNGIKDKRIFSIIIWLIFIFSITYTVSAEVVSYPLQSCFKHGKVRSVSINQSGNEYNIPVREFALPDTIFYDYAHFSFSGTVTIKIRNEGSNIASYKISPDSYNMTGTVSGKDLYITLSESRYFQVVINNQTDRPIFINADPLETDVPSDSGDEVYNVMAPPYGADNSGETNITKQIQKAIDDANKAGGGTVYIPSGIFKISKLNLKSNVDLYLQGGSVLKGLNYAEGARSTRMLEGSGVSNIKIYGRGTIWCNGIAANNYQQTEKSGTTLIAGIRLTDNSTNILIDGITISESTVWTIGLYSGSNNITVKNIKIMNCTHWNWNDGYDVCGGHHINIYHCLYVGRDDASCCKMYENYPVHDVHFSDMVMKSHNAAGFKAGMQAYANLYNITVENYRIITCQRAFHFDHWYGTGDWGGNIVVKNFWVDEITGTKSKNLDGGSYVDCPFRFVIFDKDGSGVGPIHDILVENINYPSGPNNSYLLGESLTNKIYNIEFKDCKYKGVPVTNAPEGRIEQLDYTEKIKFTKSK